MDKIVEFANINIDLFSFVTYYHSSNYVLSTHLRVHDGQSRDVLFHVVCESKMVTSEWVLENGKWRLLNIEDNEQTKKTRKRRPIIVPLDYLVKMRVKTSNENIYILLVTSYKLLCSTRDFHEIFLPNFQNFTPASPKLTSNFHQTFA